MAKDATYTRRINLYINGKEVKNNVSSIRSEMRKLIAAQNKMIVGSKEYNQTGAEIQRLNNILKKHRQQLSSTSKGWGTLGDKINIARLAIGGMITGGILKFLNTFVKNSAELQQALSSLSAITGATGEDLEFYEQAAKQASKETLQSAADIVRSYELVGSKRPELLKNKEALAEVTKQAIILSEATGGKLGVAEAAEATASALNQFELSSNKAGIAINVLAAGSKEGAAAVPEITAAMDQFGAVAATGNVSLEQSVGLIETLAEKNIVGAEAGTKLRNVLLKLQEDQSNYKDGVFDLDLALENLSQSNMSITELTKKFGAENVVAAKILERNIDKVRQYTEAVTGTNVALEQQAKQNNNAISAWKKFTNFINTKLTSGPLAGWLTEKINGLTTALENLEKRLMSASDLSEKHINTLMARINQSDDASEKIDRITAAIERERETLELYQKSYDNLSWWDKQDLWYKPAKEAKALSKAIETSRQNISALEAELEKVKRQQEIDSFDFSNIPTTELIDLESNYLRVEKLLTEQQKLKLEAIQQEIRLRNQAKESEDTSGEEDIEKIEELNKKKKEAEEKLAQEIANIRQKFNLDQMSEEERELELIKIKYDELKELSNEFDFGNDYSTEIEELRSKEIAAHEEKWNKKRLEARQELEEKIQELLLDGKEKEEAAIRKKFTTVIEEAEKAGLATEELYKKMQEEIDALDEDDRDALGQTPDKWEELHNNLRTAMQYIDQIGSIWNSINQIQSNKEQQAFNQYEENIDAQKQLLNDRLEEGLISQEQYNARVANLDANLEEKREEMAAKQAEREKRLRIFEATINTAAAVVEALPNIPLSILVGAAGAAQIAAIASEPVPEYAEGGYTRGDRIYRAGEKGREWIASNDMLMDPYTGPVIQMLEDIRQRKVPSSLFAPAPPNVEEVKKSVPAFARGGYTTNTPITTSETAGKETIIDTDESASELRRMSKNIEKLTIFMSDPRNRQAIINYNTLKRQTDEDNLRGSIGRIN